MSLESKAIQKLSYSKKKFLQKEVPKLTKNEHHEIFNIIKQNSDAKYSENSRGVYINLKFLDICTIEKIIDFIKYTKDQKKKLETHSIKDSSDTKKSKELQSSKSNGITLTKDKIEKELLRLKEKKSENFVFQHFLDKLSISNIKQFSKDDGERMIFPQLKHSKIQLDGVKARLMKKCRDVNKTGTDLPFIPTDDIESEDKSIKEDKEEEKEDYYSKIISNESKNNIENLIIMSKDITNNIDEIENNIEDIHSESDYNDF